MTKYLENQNEGAKFRIHNRRDKKYKLDINFKRCKYIKFQRE